MWWPTQRTTLANALHSQATTIHITKSSWLPFIVTRREVLPHTKHCLCWSIYFYLNGRTRQKLKCGNQRILLDGSKNISDGPMGSHWSLTGNPLCDRSSGFTIKRGDLVIVTVTNDINLALSFEQWKCLSCCTHEEKRTKALKAEDLKTWLVLLDNAFVKEGHSDIRSLSLNDPLHHCSLSQKRQCMIPAGSSLRSSEGPDK